MAEGTLASAVAVPEPEPVSEPVLASPENGLKRRQSVVSDNDPKRRRLSVQHGADRSVSPRDSRKSPPRSDNISAEERRSGRRGVGAMEERKRGQRLFGALLGTLSQRSSTAAQKRRADIDQRQQAKLKLQDEEYGELKRKKRDDIIAERRSRQREAGKEALATRHKNLLAMARYLKTKTEPVLYYRPWQLRSEEDDKIEAQIEETEKLIAKEEAEFEERYRQTEEHAVPQTQLDEQSNGNNDEPVRPEDTQADDGAREDFGPVPKQSDINEANEKDDKATEESHTEPATSTANSHEHDDTSHREASRGHEDDGEEVMEEDKEDMVIY